VTVEDHGVRTGLGMSVAEWLADTQTPCRLVRLGVSDYQSSGAAADLFARVGLDAPGIARSLRDDLTG
jgi:transketolase C-terminal domain/subunit